MLADLAKGNLRNPERITWSVELFLNKLRSGYAPPDLYDSYPYSVVVEYMFLEEEYKHMSLSTGPSKDEDHAGQ